MADKQPTGAERDFLLQTAEEVHAELVARIRQVRDPGALIAMIERTGEVIDFMIRTRADAAEFHKDDDPRILTWIARAPIPHMLAVIVKVMVSGAMASGHVIARPSKGGAA